jgi:MOSC domain-containing protein
VIRVSWLAVAPVKGLALRQRDEVVLDEHGVADNRRFHIVEPTGRRTGVLEIPTLVQVGADYDNAAERLTLRFPDGHVVDGTVEIGDSTTTDFYGRPVPSRFVVGPWERALSDFARRPLRLARSERPGAGVDRGRGAVSLVSDASVEELARQAGEERVDARRFRMLIGVSGARPHEEDDWLGRQVEIGDARVRFLGTVGRCAITTRDPDTGERDLDTLRVIRGYRGFTAKRGGKRELDFGIYGDVVRPGRVRVGDVVSPLGQLRIAVS